MARLCSWARNWSAWACWSRSAELGRPGRESCGSASRCCSPGPGGPGRAGETGRAEIFLPGSSFFVMVREAGRLGGSLVAGLLVSSFASLAARPDTGERERSRATPDTQSSRGPPAPQPGPGSAGESEKIENTEIQFRLEVFWRFTP